MSQNAYSLLESGKTKIDIERLSEIAVLYNVSLLYFLDITPPKKKLLNSF